jgi:hypothetical protein
VVVFAIWIAFKHGGERNIEDLANGKETGRTDPVATPFIFLNLLEADAQCPAKFVLAHVEGKPSFAHSSTDVRINGGCVLWCVLVHLRFFHIGTLLSSSISRQLAFSPMWLLFLRIKLANMVTVQGAHDADPGEHRLGNLKLPLRPKISGPYGAG